jgi:WD40 repeat protein
MAKVFLSHADNDLALAVELHDWLAEQGHAVFLDQDPRDGLVVGKQWETQLHERLRWADAVVCVVTSAYVKSPWCAAEVGISRSRGSRLLPVIAERGVVHPLLLSIEHTDYADDPIAARQALAEALRRLDVAGAQGWPDGLNPFPGLRAFHADMRSVFFGRTAETRALAELLRSPAERAEAQVLLVIGPSGCGKSSMVRAGLIPLIAEESGWWALPPMVPGADPVGALARQLAAAARQLEVDWTVTGTRERLDRDDRALVVMAEELLLASPDGGRRNRLLVVVDQFEELLTQTDRLGRARFAELLRQALPGPVQVVGTLRPEFFDQVLTNGDLSRLPVSTFPMRSLRRESLRTVIKAPAERAGIAVDPDLVDRLVSDTDSGEALPLLAFTLAQLAKGVERGGHLSSARYDEIGGVQGALIRQADAALADAVTGGRTRSEVMSALLRLVTVDEQGRPTRWRVNRDHLPATVATSLDAFVDRRLVSTDTDNGSVVVEVAHEAFLSAWAPLAEEIRASASALRVRRAVEQSAADWAAQDRAVAHLWEGGHLAAAVDALGAHLGPPSRSAGSPAQPPHVRSPQLWRLRAHSVLETSKVDISPQANEFLRASIRHDRRTRRRTTTILSSLLVLALATAGLAFAQQSAAQHEQLIATARQLIAQSEAARGTDQRTALRLGIAADHIQSDSDTRVSLFNTLNYSDYAGTLTGHTGAVRSVAFAPDGRTLATGSDDNTVILWDMSDPNRPKRLGPPLTGHTGAVWSVAFAPDGRTLAAGSADKTVILWDVSDPVRPKRLGPPLTGHTSLGVSVAFAQGGRTLATSGLDKVIFWDVLDPGRPKRPPHTLTEPTITVVKAASAPDGRILATAGFENTLSLWDVSDPGRPRRLSQSLTGQTGEAISREVISMVFSPDGRTLATGSRDHTVILWDVSDPGRPKRIGPPLTGHTGEVVSMVFSPDGRTLATGSDDRTVILWDLSDPGRPKRLDPPLTDRTSSVDSVAFAPDGRTLAAGGSSDTVILWDVSDPVRPKRLGSPLTGHTSVVTSVAFAPDGRTLATGSFDRRVILWDVSDPSRPKRLGSPLTGQTDRVNSVMFAPDGRTLATGSGDKTVFLWDVSDPSRPKRLGPPLTGQTGGVNSLAFAPDGHTLATGADKTVVLWDVSDPGQPKQLGPPMTGHADALTSMAFAPDGRTLATGSFDNTVILWDVSDPGQPKQLGPPLTGHTSVVNSVAFAPDGRTLATGSLDHTVILWDVSDPGRPKQLGPPLTGHTQGVGSVAFGPDSRTLATGSYDTTVILWDLAKFNDLRNHAASRACERVSRGLNANEWTQYLSGLAYERTCPD